MCVNLPVWNAFERARARKLPHAFADDRHACMCAGMISVYIRVCLGWDLHICTQTPASEYAYLVNCRRCARTNLAPASANTFEHVCRTSRHVRENTYAWTHMFMTWVLMCICMHACMHTYIYTSAHARKYMYGHMLIPLYTHACLQRTCIWNKHILKWKILHWYACNDMHVDVGLHAPMCMYKKRNRWYTSTQMTHWDTTLILWTCTCLYACNYRLTWICFDVVNTPMLLCCEYSLHVCYMNAPEE